MRVQITYSTGATEERTCSDCTTLDQVCNTVFGCTLADAEEHGATVVDLDAAIEKGEEKPAEPVAEPVVAEPVAEPVAAEPVAVEKPLINDPAAGQ